MWGIFHKGVAMYYLQSRWKIENQSIYYYGMRKKPDLLKNKIHLSKTERDVLHLLPKELDIQELKILNRLIKQQIVVEEHSVKQIPQSLDEAVFCKCCAANTFIIPGLELDEKGICPICASKEETQDIKSVLKVLNDPPKSLNSRFDIALFYTGGKDSSYLLYYLSKVKKLRVLALTWEIPYMSESARMSIENAKKHLSNVEFVTRQMAEADLLKIYHKLYLYERNTCACPSLAYVLFYPEMVNENVPFFVLGNEPVQMLNLYYNHLAPKYAFSERNHRIMTFFVNILRIITLRKPLHSGQFESLMTMKQLAYGDSVIKKISGYQSDLISHVSMAIKEVPHLLDPLKQAIRRSNWSGKIPAFIHIDFNEIAGGNYNWEDVKELIEKEVGWVASKQLNKGLHTSCNIEKCKEYSQFINFYEMRSKMIPFSAIEISLASSRLNITRDQAIREMQTSMGFTLNKIEECSIMENFLGISKKTSE